MSMTDAERARNYRARLRDEGVRMPPRPPQPGRIRAVPSPEQRAAYNKGKRDKAAASRAGRPFIACDGEGAGTDELGRQNYMLLRIGEAELFHARPLGTIECLEHILAAPSGAYLVGYAFGYDSTMILRDLPPDRRQRLLDMDKFGPDNHGSGGGAVRYTYWRDYGIEYLPRNYLRVCRTREHWWPQFDADGRPVMNPETGKQVKVRGRQIIKGSTRTIYDVFAFFQCSFVRALTDWNVGTEELRASIAAEKDRRAEFHSIGPRERQYCALECVLLEELMGRFREVCREADIMPATWNGAGKLSTALHRRHNTMTAWQVVETTPLEARVMASDAYYGGRFEVMRTGQLEGVHEYDIRSAYPAAMTKLPCLEHGEWVRLTPRQCDRWLADPAAGPFVAPVKFSHDVVQRANMFGLPIRTKQGRLEWPQKGAGVYWSTEVRAALKHGCKPKFGSGWGYTRQCECKPFSWVADLYRYRQSIGADGRGKVIKLGINGLYGKLAQRIGNPRYANMIWASLITASTRAQLLDAAAHDPQAIAMMATDGIYSLRPLPLELGTDLGQWEHKHHPKLFVVQPGLYWGDRHAEDWKAKSRGISPGYFAKPDPETGEPLAAAFEKSWFDWCDWMAGSKDHLTPEEVSKGMRPPRVTLTLHLFTGLRLAQARGKPETAGAWVDRPHEIRFEWYAKRQTGSPLTWETPVSVWHYPPSGSAGKEGASVPHAGVKRDELHPDLLELMRAEMEDMPDALELGPVWV